MAAATTIVPQSAEVSVRVSQMVFDHTAANGSGIKVFFRQCLDGGSTATVEDQTQSAAECHGTQGFKPGTNVYRSWELSALIWIMGVYFYRVFFVIIGMKGIAMKFLNQGKAVGFSYLL